MMVLLTEGTLLGVPVADVDRDAGDMLGPTAAAAAGPAAPLAIAEVTAGPVGPEGAAAPALSADLSTCSKWALAYMPSYTFRLRSTCRFKEDSRPETTVVPALEVVVDCSRSLLPEASPRQAASRQNVNKALQNTKGGRNVKALKSTAVATRPLESVGNVPSLAQNNTCPDYSRSPFGIRYAHLTSAVCILRVVLVVPACDQSPNSLRTLPTAPSSTEACL